MQQPILEVVSLTKEYKNKRTGFVRKAVDNANFAVYPGEILGFIGKNGAGKTTTIKMITGLATPTSGEIYIDGKNLKNNFEYCMSKVGGIIEEPVMHKDLSGYANLKYYASLINKRVTKKEIKEIVAMVGMTARIKDKVKTYSLGMKQRLGIAQALLGSPKLLILDEPTNGLDPNGIKEMRAFLKDLAKTKQIGILICSHILSEMEQLCDRVIIIDEGIIVRQDSIEDMRKVVAKSEKTAIKVNYPNYAGKVIMDHYRIPVEVAGRLVIFPSNEDAVANITKTLTEKKLSIYGIEKITKSLEEIFVEIINNNNRSINSTDIY